MFRRQLIAAVLAACCLLVTSAGASARLPTLHAAAAKKAPKPAPAPLPVVKSVTPLRLSIGETLTIVGRNFVPGKGHNTVVFFRDGAPAVFLRAGTATKTHIKVTLTSKLGRWLIPRNTGDSAPTRFRLRVLARRFGAQLHAAQALAARAARPEQKIGRGHAGRRPDLHAGERCSGARRGRRRRRARQRARAESQDRSVHRRQRRRQNPRRLRVRVGARPTTRARCPTRASVPTRTRSTRATRTPTTTATASRWPTSTPPGSCTGTRASR